MIWFFCHFGHFELITSILALQYDYHIDGQTWFVFVFKIKIIQHTIPAFDFKGVGIFFVFVISPKP